MRQYFNKALLCELAIPYVAGSGTSRKTMFMKPFSILAAAAAEEHLSSFGIRLTRALLELRSKTLET